MTLLTRLFIILASTSLLASYSSSSNIEFEPVQAGDDVVSTESIEAAPFPRSRHGVYDSQGGDCADDSNLEDTGNVPSLYRESGNLRSNASGNCMVLYITDSSQFDADMHDAMGERTQLPSSSSLNGAVTDPVAMTGGAGSAISPTQFAGITVLLLLATAYGMYRRRKQPQPIRIIVKK